MQVNHIGSGGRPPREVGIVFNVPAAIAGARGRPVRNLWPRGLAFKASSDREVTEAKKVLVVIKATKEERLRIKDLGPVTTVVVSTPAKMIEEIVKGYDYIVGDRGLISEARVLIAFYGAKIL